MSDRAPYSRVYWSIVDDPKFALVFDDDRRLATWLRLLIIADQAHPASANIPHGTHRPSLNALVECELIDLGTGSRYRVHGLDRERARRREAATSVRRSGKPEPDPDGNHSGPKRDPNGFGTQGRRRDEQSKDELSRADARETEPHIDAWLMVKHRLPTVAQQGFFDRYLAVFDETGPHRMAQLILENPADPIDALKKDLDQHREERLGEIRDFTPKPRPKPKREPWQEEFRRLVAAREAEISGPIEEVS